MTIKGCDFAGGRPGADALRQAGIGFVARYLAESLGASGGFKNLTAAALRSDLLAGIFEVGDELSTGCRLDAEATRPSPRACKNQSAARL